MRFFADNGMASKNTIDQASGRPASRTRLRAGSRVVGFAAVVVAVGLFAAGCGGGKPRASVASLGSTTTTTTTPAGAGSGGETSGAPGSPPNASSGSGGGFALSGGGGVEELTKFAGCMRQNGVPNFPDPNAQGQISFSSANGVDPSSAQFQQAQQACQKLLPNRGQPSPAQQAQARTQVLAFSACMRSHGVPNFPDPQFGSGGRVSIKVSLGAGLDPRSPQFQAAQQACQKDLPGSPGAGQVGVSTKAVGGGSSGGQ